MATYGRGRHILPSVQSVLQQECQNFELIIVGDNCQDETEAVVSGLQSDKVRWMNLQERCGSQSAPNNAGIAAARGQIIAYLGHDDIWEHFHLSDLSKLFETHSSLDFAVGGLLCHLPSGLEGGEVMGLFHDENAQHKHFFPPSSFAHRQDVVLKIGPWRQPLETRAPVDADFLIRAARAGLSFRSTGRISVHKFVATQRYLSYLSVSSDEQIALIQSMQTPGYTQKIQQLVEASKSNGFYMSNRYIDFSKMAPGEIARGNALRKGLAQTTEPLPTEGIVLKQTAGPRGLDWREHIRRGVLWALRNPKPKVLIPYTGVGKAKISMRIFHKKLSALEVLSVNLGKEVVEVRRSKLGRSLRYWYADFEVIGGLSTEKPLVLELCLQQAQIPGLTKKGIGLGDIKVTQI